jgi:type IV secretory pathway TrbF-like protein
LDQASHLIGLGVPAKGADAFNEGVRIELLKQWIGNTRTVLQNWEAQKVFVEWALHHTSDQPHHAFTKLQNWYSEHSPLERGKQGSITVTVNSPLRMTDRSNVYQVNWTETNYDPNGTKIGETRWTGIFSLTLTPPKSLEQAAGNPAGFFMTEFNWSAIQ